MRGLKFEPYIWPALIIFLGLIFSLRPWYSYGFKKRIKDSFLQFDAPAKLTDSTDSIGFAAPTDYLKINSVLSGVNRKVLSKDFNGAKISSVFGGTEIDFMQADFTGAAVIKMEIVFGGVKLFVPAHWVVVNEIDGVFHGVILQSNKYLVEPCHFKNRDHHFAPAIFFLFFNKMWQKMLRSFCKIFFYF